MFLQRILYIIGSRCDSILSKEKVVNKMKVLTLTAKCGMGHFQCAKAIEEQLKKDFYLADVECVDIYEIKFDDKSELFYKCYNTIVESGNLLYNLAYKKITKNNQNPTLTKIMSKILLDDFSRFIKIKNPDIVISTYSFTSQLMSLYKEKTGSQIPLITWITDVKPHNGWVNFNTDKYIIADEVTKEELQKLGIDVNKIKIGGIPISNKFDFEISKNKNNKKNILVMGGGLGLLPKKMKFYEKLASLPDVEVTIVTGKNKKLYHKLIDKFPTLNILGYVNNIDYLMQNSDILLTKAGGITTFEAIYNETPMIVFKPFLEQEVHNAEYISNKEIGYVLPSKMKRCQKDIDLILEIVENDDLLEDMKYNIRKIKNGIDSNVLEETILEESVQKC